MTITKKKKSVQMRVEEDVYNLIRRRAFKEHRPMTEILKDMMEEWKAKQKLSTS